jgi:hypothetical protein
MKLSRHILMAILTIHLVATGAHAEEDGEAWRPCDDGSDWVQLNNKEWLMGEIKPE